MTKRVLLVRSNPIAPDPRVEKTARALADAEYGVTVLGWDRTATLPRSRQRPYGAQVLLPIRAAFGRGLGNTPQLMRWQWGLLRWLLRHRRDFDVIHACDFDTILPALFAAQRFGKQVVYDVFDFYADHLRATPRWVLAILRRMELWAVGRADAVIVADKARIEQIEDGNPKSVTVIYNTPEDVLDNLQAASGEQQDSDSPSSAVHRPSSPPRPRSPVSGHVSQKSSLDFRLAYVGLLHIERGLRELLEVLSEHPDWSLELAGFGGDEARILELAEPLPNVRFHGRIDYDSALQLMYNADALIGTYDPAILNHRYASPNKLFEAMMLAKPIVVARGTNMDRIVERHTCGLVVPYGDLWALESAIDKLASNRDLRERLGANGRRAYNERYNWSVMRTRLTDLYAGLLNSKGERS
jgi:glycosyltransferase involved in cell wall biosynthesis